MKVDDDYFPIVESAMDDSREALTRLCQQDPTVDARMPPNNLNDSVSAWYSLLVVRVLMRVLMLVLIVVRC